MKLRWGLHWSCQTSSLPLLGAWIEIASEGTYLEREGRSLYRERGLKSAICRMVKQFIMSLPLPGAWIEIFGSGHYETIGQSLPLPGAWIEILVNAAIYCIIVSLPLPGAWIEIEKIRAAIIRSWSLPLPGAWIEMQNAVITYDGRISRSLYRERKLK